MKELMHMRTTLNISEDVLKEAEALYETGNRSKAVEEALKDAIRMKKKQKLKGLRGKIQLNLDAEDIDKLRSDRRLDE
jgi:metal-responsive CopG/Arc/MetJ family transcriptional regulator